MSKQDYFQSGKYERSSKLFITNLPPNMPQDQLKTDIEPLFEKLGAIRSINVKKHKSGQYSYCFLEFEKVQDAIRAIQQMDQILVHERPMKVRQDRQGDGCFHCKKPGHFAKECPEKYSRDRSQRRRSYSSRSPGSPRSPYKRRSSERNMHYHQRRHRRERDRSRSRSHNRDRHQRRSRPRQRQRSRDRQYSPYSHRRRQHHRRQRMRRSKTPRSRSRSPRSRSNSYEDRGRYRRRNDFQSKRQERRYSRDGNHNYRRRSRSRSSSYQQRRGH